MLAQIGMLDAICDNSYRKQISYTIQEDTMKPIIKKTVSLLLCSASSAFAASGAEHDGTGLFFWLFIGFAAMIIIFQFMPGVMMFFGMAKGLFGAKAKDSAIVTGTRQH